MKPKKERNKKGEYIIFCGDRLVANLTKKEVIEYIEDEYKGDAYAFKNELEDGILAVIRGEIIPIEIEKSTICTIDGITFSLSDEE